MVSKVFNFDSRHGTPVVRGKKSLAIFSYGLKLVFKCRQFLFDTLEMFNKLSLSLKFSKWAFKRFRKTDVCVVLKET